MAAVDYARWFHDTLGLQVVPLYAPAFGPAGGVCRCRAGASCESPGKHPVGRYKGQPSRLPTGYQNYGVVLGRFVVVDVDDRAILDDLHGVLGFDLPDTWAVDTGKGRHYWFEAPEPMATRLGAFTKVDLKSGTTYVVGPGSISVTGTVYEPINTLPIASAPEALLKACGKAKRHVDTMVMHTIPRTTSPFGLDWVRSRCDEMRSSNTRNNTLLRITCEFLRAGWVGEDSIALLADAAIEAGLGEEEVRRTQDSARRMVVGE